MIPLNQLKNQLCFQMLPPLSLYIHLPWCLKKCPYCDFNSHAIDNKQDIPFVTYIEALIKQVEYFLPLIWKRPIHSIFLGGGTPSLFPAASISDLLQHLRSLLPISAFCEITMEANPGALECDNLNLYREAGINRISLGIQSFGGKQLQALGRIHSSNVAIAALEAVHDIFETFNVDLMYGLPLQGLENLNDDLDMLLSFKPPHISYYHLTIEPHTTFFHAPPPLPSEEVMNEMQDLIDVKLSHYHYEHYETSAYAQKKHLCQHNLNYWTYGDYIGIGAGAAGKVSFPEGRIERFMTVKQPKHFLEVAGTQTQFISHNTLNNEDILFEFVMNAFRLQEGFSWKLFINHTGLPLYFGQEKFEEAESCGFIKMNNQHVVTTKQGKRFLNNLLLIFLPSATR